MAKCKIGQTNKQRLSLDGETHFSFDKSTIQICNEILSKCKGVLYHIRFYKIVKRYNIIVKLCLFCIFDDDNDKDKDNGNNRDSDRDFDSDSDNENDNDSDNGNDNVFTNTLKP